MKVGTILKVILMLTSAVFGNSCISQDPCAYELAGQIAESSVSHDFRADEGSVRLLLESEKKELFKQIEVPSCVKALNFPESKYEVGMVGSGNGGFEVYVWLSGEKPPKEFKR